MSLEVPHGYMNVEANRLLLQRVSNPNLSSDVSQGCGRVAMIAVARRRERREDGVEKDVGRKLGERGRKSEPVTEADRNGRREGGRDIFGG